VPNFTRRQILAAGSAVAAGSLLPFRSLFAAEKKLVIGALYVGPHDDYGYNQSHAQAIATLKTLPGVKVVEQENVPETVAVDKAMEAMIVEDGASLLFVTSFGYFSHAVKLAPKYPDVRFAHCGGLWKAGTDPVNVGSYFGYIDECQYLNGVAAGYATKSKKLGFVAAKPIPQVLRNINSFTLGAQSVKPDIATSVIFTGDWSVPVKEAESTNSLADQGIDVVTCHVDSPKVLVETAEKRGIMVCGYHANQAVLAPKGYLTGAEWNWETIYKQYAAAAQSGAPFANFTRGGLKDGFVRMSPYTAAVSPQARAKIDAIKTDMIAGKFDIFKGPINDNTGKLVIPAGTTYAQTDLTLEDMNYLVAGVVGTVSS
jgi:simple sugar transport system substrate-binding protein